MSKSDICLCFADILFKLTFTAFVASLIFLFNYLINVSQFEIWHLDYAYCILISTIIAICLIVTVSLLCVNVDHKCIF